MSLFKKVITQESLLQLFIKKVSVRESKYMIWPPQSPDLNRLEFLWDDMGKEMYEKNVHFGCLT
jgi:transposase